MTTGESEKRLLERAREGDREAFRELYERFSSRVFSVVRRIAGDEELARDYAQEAWLRAMRGLSSFRGDARFSTWIHRIAVNVALQGSRVAERRRGVEAPLPETLAGPPERHDALLAQRLEDALDRVPSRMREVLVLHDVEGYTHEEIAQTLGVATGTSKSQLSKARARMRAILTEFQAGVGPALLSEVRGEGLRT